MTGEEVRRSSHCATSPSSLVRLATPEVADRPRYVKTRCQEDARPLLRQTARLQLLYSQLIDLMVVGDLDINGENIYICICLR